MRFRVEHVEALANSVPAISIATCPVTFLEPSLSCADAWGRLCPSAYDFDMALVRSDDGPISYVRRDEAWALDPRALERLTEPVPEGALLVADAMLREALDSLEGFGFCVVCDAEGRAHGIITAADVQKPAGSLWAFGVILSFESAAAMLFPSLMDRRWKSSLRGRERKEVDRRVERYKESGRYLSEVDCLFLEQKARLTRLALEQADLLPIPGEEWEHLTKAMNELRNDLAHGRGLSGAAASLKETIGVLRDTQDLPKRLWAMVDDREDVWERYLRTECLAELRGERHRIEDIRKHLPKRFWMLSAQNPRERLLSDVENERRHRALVEEVKRRGWLVCEGVGRAPGAAEGWEERMVLAQGMGRDDACSLSERYGQRSVFEFDGGSFRVIAVETGDVRREREASPAC